MPSVTGASLRGCGCRSILSAFQNKIIITNKRLSFILPFCYAGFQLYISEFVVLFFFFFWTTGYILICDTFNLRTQGSIPGHVCETIVPTTLNHSEAPIIILTLSLEDKTAT